MHSFCKGVVEGVFAQATALSERTCAAATTAKGLGQRAHNRSGVDRQAIGRLTYDRATVTGRRSKKNNGRSSFRLDEIAQFLQLIGVQIKQGMVQRGGAKVDSLREKIVARLGK